MGQLTFILGGAGSGKSRFAVELAKRCQGEIVFVATCSAEDKEMEKKIKNHKKERPAHWKTVEATKTPFQISFGHQKIDALLVDSLTLWVSTMLMEKFSSDEIKQRCAKFLIAAREKIGHTIVVSDEVGFGIVPGNRLARSFREALGAVNQESAGIADSVFLVTAGLPIQLKGNMRVQEVTK